MPGWKCVRSDLQWTLERNAADARASQWPSEELARP